ncbi:MAG: hypothetical protein HWD59_12915 [Coxiellaceae bacterium]|nr:MAG: hypothetical protein HWD59_12915 [Coxiellaceae bacterium]
MAKLPDLTKLTSKFDLQGIVDSVKSVINPGSAIPANLEGDPVAAKLALVSQALDQLSQVHAQQEQQIAKITALINSIYQDLSANKTATDKTAAPEAELNKAAAKPSKPKENK